MVEWLRAFAQQRHLRVREDAKGNVVIYKGGQGGGEGAPPVIMQGHVDMVCEANASSTHDFDADPIRLVVDAGWLKADGTTLGADNGVGESGGGACGWLAGGGAVGSLQAIRGLMLSLKMT